MWQGTGFRELGANLRAEVRCPPRSPPAAVPCCGQTRCCLYYRGSDSAWQCLCSPRGWGIWPASCALGRSQIQVEHFPPSPGGVSQPQQGPGTRWSWAAPGESQSPARPRWRVWAGPLGGKQTGLLGCVPRRQPVLPWEVGGRSYRWLLPSTSGLSVTVQQSITG